MKYSTRYYLEKRGGYIIAYMVGKSSPIIDTQTGYARIWHDTETAKRFLFAMGATHVESCNVD